MAIMAKETEKRALIHTGNDAEASDNTIYGFDRLIASGDKHIRAITPRFYNAAPKWLGDKEWKKAKREFNKVYAVSGASAFDTDDKGRLIMPLPMTPGRYMGAVVSGDVATVLYFSGAWTPTKDSTFAMLAAIDNCAPIISAVYRSGAALNAAEKSLGKAQGKVDAASDETIDSLTVKRDLCRKGLDAARESFVKSYIAAVRASDSLTKVAQDAAIKALEALTVAPVAPEQDAPIIPPTIDQDAVDARLEGLIATTMEANGIDRGAAIALIEHAAQNRVSMQ